MVEVVVSRLGLDGNTQAYVVILQERGGNRVLPIWIGQPEAESIVMQMHSIKRTRPLTHDLCRNLILGMGGALRRVEITRVEKNTYFAELHIARGEELAVVDARPSDSIAIALRLDAPIYAADDLLTTLEESEEGEEEGFTVDAGTAESEPQSGGELSAEQLKAYLEHLRPEDFGKFKL